MLIVALLIVRGVAQWTGQPPIVLGILAAASLLLAVGAVVWAFAPLRHRPSDARVARFIEERAPALDDRLVSAVDVINGPPRGGDYLRTAMLADAAARAREIDLDTILPAEALRRSGFRAATAVLLLIIVGGIASAPAREAWDAASLRALSSRAWPRGPPGRRARHQAGAALSIEARLVGNRAPVVARVEVARTRSMANRGEWPEIRAEGSASLSSPSPRRSHIA